MRSGSPLPHAVAPGHADEQTDVDLFSLLLGDGQDWSWMDRAACRDRVESAEDDVFFSPDLEEMAGDQKGRAREAARRQRIALAFCRRCPVQTECLRYAITTKQA